jgi:branched-chain amino acid transport system substrate-binding protein
VYFPLAYEPIEMHTAATEQFTSDLTAAGVSGELTFAMYNGYVSVGLLVQGLQAAGARADPICGTVVPGVTVSPSS